MYPHRETRKIFEYPVDHLLKLQGVLKEDEMRHPDMLDSDGERCLLVIKKGNTTGLTIGRAIGIFSCVREYFSDGTNQTSREWSILPYGNKSGVFSEAGDSGSIIADTRGRISLAVLGPLTSRTRRPSSGSSSVSKPTGSQTPTSTRS